MGVVTSAHGIRINASPYPNPHPNRIAVSVAVPTPTVTVVSGGSGTPPTPVLVVPTATTGYLPHNVIAQGFGTTAGSSAITSYSFNYGDGTTISATRAVLGGNAPIPISRHRYTVAGTYTLSMTVTDANGNSVSQSQTITVTARPAATVTVNPGGDIIAALNALPAGGVLQANAGVYTANAAWTPKNNQIFYANGVVTITGGSTRPVFAYPSTSTGVVIQGIRLTAFTQWAFYFGNAGSGASVTFKDVEIDTCGTNGTVSGAMNGYLGGTITLDTCHFHHNVLYNIAGGQAASYRIIDGEYDHGFTDTSGAFSPRTDDGVHKHVRSSGDYIVGANSHDNQGQGWWWDGGNINVYVCLCTVTNNYGNGIFSEINDAAAGGTDRLLAGNLDGSGFSIRWLYNTLTGNGYPAHASFPTGNIYPGQFFIAKSDKIEIAYNWVDGGSHAITLDYEVSRPEGHNLANISVHHNDIRLRETGTSGAGSGAGRVGFLNSYAGTAYTLTNITFANNRYYAAHDSSTWEHFIVYTGTSAVNNTFAQWKANGYDTTGSTMSLDTAWPH